MIDRPIVCRVCRRHVAAWHRGALHHVDGVTSRIDERGGLMLMCPICHMETKAPGPPAAEEPPR